MMNLVKIAIVLVALVTGCLALIPRTETAHAVTVEDAQASLFRSNCARCHGMDGHANTPDGQKAEADDLTDGGARRMSNEKMARLIRNGKGKMPAFGRKLSAAQINSLVSYVKSRF